MIEKIKSIDRSLFLSINENYSDTLDVFFTLISDGWIFVPLWIFIAFYIVKIKSWKYFILTAVCISFCVLMTDQTSNFVKKNYKRYRPSHNLELAEKVHSINGYKGGQFGFYSGHASNSFGVAVFLFLLLAWVGSAYRYALFIYPILVGYSRIYMGVHYPIDILAGYLDGLIFGFLSYKLFQFIYKQLLNAKV